MRKCLCVLLLSTTILCTACVANKESSTEIEDENSQKKTDGYEEVKELTESVQIETEEPVEEQIIEYNDETQTKICFYDFELKLSRYHVVKSVEKGDEGSFYFEEDEENNFGPKELHIVKGVEFVQDEIAANDYFEQYGKCNSILHYENIQESDIREIYKGTYEDEERYLMRYADETYLVRTNYWSIEDRIVSLTVDKYLVYEKDNFQVDNCGINGKALDIISEKNVSENTEVIKIGKNKDEKEYQLVLNIDRSDSPCINTMEVLSDDESVHIIEWESRSVYQNNPQFMDLNLDGYVDFVVKYDEGTKNSEYYFYVWNPQNCQFENATEEGLLSADFRVEEGQIINWGGSGNGYAVEVLKWDDNTLVKTEECYVEPDEE